MSADEADALAMPLILLVEDEDLIREMLVEALEAAGFSTLAAADAQEAVALFAQDGHEIRGLVTDINLAEGMDGWELACAAREKSGDLPVVYVSGASGHEWASRCAQQPDDHQALRAGADRRRDLLAAGRFRQHDMTETGAGAARPR